MKFESKFNKDDKVIIDGDQSLQGTVTSFQFRPVTDEISHATIEVSYVHNGSASSAWIEERRLMLV